MQWNIEEIDYLRDLSKTCSELSQRYKTIHDSYKKAQSHIRIPVIIASSIAGVASFGSGTFPPNSASMVSISIGIVNIIISITTSIEAFFQYQLIIENSLKVSNELQKLKDEIDLELSMPIAERELAGVSCCRKAFADYESIISNAPSVLKRIRFIRDAPIQRQLMPSVSVSINDSFEAEGLPNNKCIL